MTYSSFSQHRGGDHCSADSPDHVSSPSPVPSVTTLYKILNKIMTYSPFSQHRGGDHCSADSPDHLSPLPSPVSWTVSHEAGYTKIIICYYFFLSSKRSLGTVLYFYWNLLLNSIPFSLISLDFPFTQSLIIIDWISHCISLKGISGQCSSAQKFYELLLDRRRLGSLEQKV